MGLVTPQALDKLLRSNAVRGDHEQVILILFRVHIDGGALFLAEGFLYVILQLFLKRKIISKRITAFIDLR